MQKMKNIIKKPIKKQLKDNLQYMTVSYLKELAEIYEVNKVYKMKKQELVDVLYDRLTDENYLIANLAAFNESEEHNKVLFGDAEELDTIRAFGYSKIGISYIYDLGDGNAESIIPDDMLEVLNKLNENSLTSVKERYSKIFSYIRAFNNLYGTYEAHVLIDTFNAQNKDNGIHELTSEELVYCLYKYNIFNEPVVFDGINIICGALCMDEDDYKQVAEGQQGKDYYIPEKEELLKHSNDYYIKKTKYYDDLHKYLMKLINSKKDVDDIIIDIYSGCVMDIFNIQDFVQNLEMMGITLKSMEELNKLAGLCINFSNNSPKWVNRGWTPADLNRHCSKQDSEANVVQYVKVGRNDPCPCGSGKKYKKCCGRA